MADEVAPPPAQPRGFFARLWGWWKALQQRLKAHYAEYGSIAIVTYLSLFVLTWIGFTIAIRSGAELVFEADVEDLQGGQSGSIGTAYIATKATQPLRILVTIAITPFVAAAWNRLRGRTRKPVEAEPPQVE